MKLINDPLGNEILLRQPLPDFNDHVQSEGILDDISKVIEKPIMLFKLNEGCSQLYYLRAIGWNKTILLKAQKNNAHFEVVGYEMDPTVERINELHKKAQRLI